VKFVIVAFNSDRKFAVMGSPGGSVFPSLSAAERAARQYRRQHPSLDVQVAEIQGWAA